MNSVVSFLQALSPERIYRNSFSEMIDKVNKILNGEDVRIYPSDRMLINYLQLRSIPYTIHHSPRSINQLTESLITAVRNGDVKPVSEVAFPIGILTDSHSCHTALQFKELTDHYGYDALFLRLVNRDRAMEYCLLPEYENRLSKCEFDKVKNYYAVEYLDNKPTINQMMEMKKKRHRMAESVIDHSPDGFDSKYLPMLIANIDYRYRQGEINQNTMSLIIALYRRGMIDLTGYRDNDYINHLLQF